MRLLATLFGNLAPDDLGVRFDEAAADMHVSAAVFEALQMSHGDLANLLRTALRAAHPGERTYVWTRDVYDDVVVYEVNTEDQSELFQRSYTITDGAVTLGDPLKVIAVTQYVPAETAAIAVPATQVTQVSQPAEESANELTGDAIPLLEKAVKKDGTIALRIIAPGQGSSGYYPSDVLKRDGPRVFTSGLHMHLDHPSISEESDRPERSVTTLAGTLTSDARWDENGAAGPGLYADAKVRRDLAPLIEELAPHIGVSIRALGKAGMREVDGKKVRSIEAIEQAKSVDFVTVPGAGGKVLDLIESARTRVPGNPSGREDDVSKEELEEAQRQLGELRAQFEEQGKQLAQLRERELLQQARQIVVTTLNETALPAMTRQRLTDSLAGNPPLTEAGEIDREALAAKITEAITAESAYIATLTGGNPIRGMGSTTPTTPEVPALEESEQRISEALAGL